MVEAGNTILIDDGLIGLKVKEIKDGTDIVCDVINGGLLGSRKGVNVPNVRVNLPSITEKDKADIEFGLENGIDFIAASFIRNAEAVEEIKDIIGAHNMHVGVISKIENMEGVENIERSSMHLLVSWLLVVTLVLKYLLKKYLSYRKRSLENDTMHSNQLLQLHRC